MKPISAIAAILLTASAAAHAADLSSYTPRVNGTVRSRFEMETYDGRYRFQVRNARVSLTGNIAPSISYFINTDLCDHGKMKILDAWGRIALSQAVAVQAGQFRMPFGVEPFRAPHNYIFANRSFIGKQMCNYRAVGAMMSVTLPRVPLKIEAGAFNPTTIGDHDTWNDKVAAAGKLTFTPGGWSMSAGGSTLMVKDVRANLTGLSIGHKGSCWEGAAEYMYKHFTHRAYKAAHAYCAWGRWTRPVEAGVFNTLSLEGRVDGMTRHCDDPSRTRLTGGVTLGYHRGSVWADVRANYEKYFYSHDSQEPQGQRDKAVLELVVRF